MCVAGEKQMKIEKFYYDEKQQMINEIRQEMETCGQEWEPEKDPRFMDIVRKVVQFAETSGCNLKIETDSDRSAMIRMQTDGIWILCDGETSLQEKEIMQKLFQKADYVHIGNRERNGRSMVELEFNIKMD